MCHLKLVVFTFGCHLLSYLGLFLKFLIQLLNDVIFVVVEQRQVLYVHISVLKLLFQLSYLAFLLIHNDEFRVDVLRRDVRDLRGLARIIKSAQILFKVLIRWR